MPRTDDDNWDLASSVGATATFVASGRAMATKDPNQGAATTLWAATSKELDGLGGLYLEDCHIADVTPGDGSAGYAPHAVDPDQAARLWAWSEEQTAT